LYLRGLGVPKDVVRAYTWASIAAQNQPTPELRSIASQMNPGELREAEDHIAAWHNRRMRAPGS
jgi:TPR repeat protein